MTEQEFLDSLPPESTAPTAPRKAKPQPIPQAKPAPRAQAARPADQVGIFEPEQVVRLLVALARVGAWVLVALSVVGTFYGLQSKPAPLATPWQIPADLFGTPNILALAAGVQGVLMLMQWGTMVLGAHYRRERDGRAVWAYAAYGIALVVSVAYNWKAYEPGLAGLGMAWYFIAVVVVGADIFPEHTLIKRKRA